MVSNASDDLPDPDRPVITTSLCRGMSTSMFLRLWTRAPRTAIQLCAMVSAGFLPGSRNFHFITADHPPVRCRDMDMVRQELMLKRLLRTKSLDELLSPGLSRTLPGDAAPQHQLKRT